MWTTSFRAITYTIYITDNNGYNQTYSIPNTSSSYIIDGLNEFTEYTISITATNSVGSSEPVSTNYTVGINFNFNYKTTNTAITNTDVLSYLPFITGNGLTIDTAKVYVNIQPDNVDPNKRLVSVEIPPESFTFTDNTTTNNGLSFQSFNYYFFENVTEIKILFFGNNGTQTKIIPLSRGGTQFGFTSNQITFPFTISNSDRPYILTTTSFENMFYNLTQFNSDISGWVVSLVTDMSSMFYGATSFNNDISGWVVSLVTDMSSMFYGATSFNNDISGWVVSLVTDMSSMFYGATDFNNGGLANDTTRPMTGWIVPLVTNHNNFGTGSQLYYTGHPYGNIQPNYWEYVPLPPSVTATYNSGDYNNYSVLLTWNSVAGATSYDVELKNNNNSVLSELNKTSPYIFYGLSLFDNLGNNTYIFSVRAVNSQGGSSAYSSATNIQPPTVDTVNAVSGIDSAPLYINYVDITLTGSNSGPFYKITTTPNTGATSTLSDSWTTSIDPTIQYIRNNLITNFNYDFTITAYNIAGAESSNSATISDFKATNNFMFSYTTSALPPRGTSGGDATQQQREGIFNYLPFYFGNPTSYATTGQLTLNTLLYTTDTYITWTPTSPYTVTVSFPQFHTDGITSTPLWEYESPNPTPTTLGIRMAGIAIFTDFNPNNNQPGNRNAVSEYYRTCSLLSYNNFGSIPIAGMCGLFCFQSFVNTAIITNHSIPIIPLGTNVVLFVNFSPLFGSSLNLSNWDVSNALGLSITYACNFSNVDINISHWNPIRAISIFRLLAASTFKSPMNMDLTWNLPNLQDNAVEELFFGSNFNSKLNFIFSPTKSFSMYKMFVNASVFNQDISTRTDGNTTYWDVSKVTNMSNMFERAQSFNQPINSWDVGNVTNMFQMFLYCRNFNSSLNNWNVSNVENMQYMFAYCDIFNQPLDNWGAKLSKVKDMTQLFVNNYLFNQNISSWDVSNVNNMSQMFYGCANFNQPLDNWANKLSKVTTMFQMFYNATKFNNGGDEFDTTRPMTGWIVPLVTTHTNFGTGSQLYYTNHPTGNIQPNYWEYQVLDPTGVSATYIGGTYNNYSVELTWTTVLGASSYNVKLTTNTTTDSIYPISRTLNSYTFTLLNVANTYSFSVQAVNAGYPGYPSAYIQANPSNPTVGSSPPTASSGMGLAPSYINYANISFTNASGPFYKLETSPNTRVSPTDAVLWITPTILSNFTSIIDNLITNLTYEFTITSYNIAGASSSGVIFSFIPESNFIFLYTSTQLPDPDTNTTGDPQRKGIFNYLPFYFGTSASTSGTLTLNELLYTTSNYINWAYDSPTLTYTVTISFPKKHTDNTTNLWVYSSAISPDVNNLQAQAGIALTDATAIAYYKSCTSITYNNFSTIPIASKQGLFYDGSSNTDYDYTGIFNITNNSIPVISTKTSLILLKRVKPASPSSINLSNWDVTNVEKMESMLNTCDFYTNNIAIDISRWNVSNVAVIYSIFVGTQFGTMADLTWDLQKITTMYKLFDSSNFNSNLYFIFPQTSTSIDLSNMFYNATSFNNSINTSNSYWDVSNVVNMSSMFQGATAFNMSLNTWNPASVSNMNSMFKGATSFNNGYTSSYAIVIPLTWVNPSTSVANVTNMNSMFENASMFNNGCPINNASNPMNYGSTQWILPLHPSHTDFGTNSKLFQSNPNGNADPFYPPQVLNGNFTDPTIGVNSYEYIYNSLTRVPNWNFEKGILLNNSAAFNLQIPYPLPGTQSAALQVVQVTDLMQISQTINFGVGTYTLSWYSCPRDFAPPRIEILIDSSVIYSYTSPTTNSWVLYTCPVIIMTSGPHTLTIRAQPDGIIRDRTSGVKGFVFTI
jgi:surface protein